MITRTSIKLLLLILFISCSKSEVGRVTTFDGVSIEYESRGKGEPTIVLVHGWCCDRTYWEKQVAYFSERYRVVTLDLAGHGNSGLDRSMWSMPAYGKDIKAVVEKLDLGQIVIVGHSAGAYAALAGANLLKERTICVIGVDGFRFSTPDYLERRFSDESIREYADNFPEDIATHMASIVRRYFFLSQSDTNLINWVAEDMGKAPREVAIPASQAMTRYHNGELQDALRSVGGKIPIIEIRSGDMGKVALEHVRGYAPMFEVVYQYGVGHFLMMEAPDEFNRILEEQITRIISIP